MTDEELIIIQQRNTNDSRMNAEANLLLCEIALRPRELAEKIIPINLNAPNKTI